jgi:hypothetical protein
LPLSKSIVKNNWNWNYTSDSGTLPWLTSKLDRKKNVPVRFKTNKNQTISPIGLYTNSKHHSDLKIEFGQENLVVINGRPTQLKIRYDKNVSTCLQVPDYISLVYAAQY